jgi:predicted esterase
MIRTESIEVRRTALIAALGPEPGPAVRELWYILHGQAMRAAEFLHTAKALDDGTRLLVAPEALNRHYTGEVAARDAPVGATWMTKAERDTEIGDYVAYLDAVHDRVAARFGGPPPPVTVLGFSQGGATGVRWAALGRVPVAHLVVWASSVPPDVDYRALVARHPGMRVTYVAGTRDKYLTPRALDAQHAVLRAAGVQFSFIRFDGGHRLDDGALRQVAAR